MKTIAPSQIPFKTIKHMGKRPQTLLLLILLSGWFSTGYAQVERNVLPSELKHQTIITQPLTLNKGFLRTGLSYSHFFIDKIFDENMKKTSLSGSYSSHSANLSLMLMYGITDRLEISAGLPYVNESLNQSVVYYIDNTAETVRWSQKGNGLGDVSLGMRYLLGGRNNSGNSMVLGTSISLPTGQKNPEDIKDDLNFSRPTGSGEPVLTFETKVRKVIYPYSLSLYGSYDLHLGGEKIMVPNGDPVKFIGGNSLALIAGTGFHVNDWIVIANDLGFGIRGKELVDGKLSEYIPWKIDYAPYIYFQIKKLRLVQSVNIPIKGYVYGADPMYLVLVQYIL